MNITRTSKALDMVRTGKELIIARISRMLIITLSQCLVPHTLPVIEFYPYLWDDGSYLLFDDGSVIGV